MARKKARSKKLSGGKAWGNALGGFRTQKRNAFGQFGAGTPARRGSAPSFTSGGTPRYYAPGGKTYATKRPTGTSTAKQKRRQAGIDAAVARKEAARQKTVRRRKVVAGVAVGALAVGGAIALSKSSKGRGSGLPSSNAAGPAPTPGSPTSGAIGSSQIRKMIGSRGSFQANSSPNDPADNLMNGVKARMRAARAASATMGRSKFKNGAGAVNSAPSTEKDNGYSAATAIVKALPAGGAALGMARQAQEVLRNANDMSSRNRRIGQDGVSEAGRHIPEAATMPRAYADHQNLASVVDGMADNRFSVLSHKSMTPGESNDSWEKELTKHGVVMKEYGKSSDQYGEGVVQAKRAPMEPGTLIGSGDGLHTEVGLRKGAKASKGGLDINDPARGKEANRIQAKYAEGLVIGPNAGKSRNVRNANAPVRIEAADVSASRATGGSTPRKWTESESAEWDRQITNERKSREARKEYQGAGGVVQSRAAFPKGKGDHDTYNQRGRVNGRTNEAEDRWNREIRNIEKATSPNPILGENMSKAQEEDLAAYLGVKASPRKLVGQPVPGSIPLKVPTAIAKNPQGEINADKYLESIQQKMTGGYKPSRFERQMVAFLTGERQYPPVDARAQLSKAENARINARARARNRRANNG